MPRRPPFSEAAARRAVAEALCWCDALRNLGYEPKGNNPTTLKKYVAMWGISTAHFDPHIGRRRASRRRRIPLQDVLVRISTYSRGNLKNRLFAAGLKKRRCELCGQGETWKGQRMSLILDHINGVGNDHRIENLRIVCPNCAATLDTHCARNLPRERSCAGCGRKFAPKYVQHRYCSQACWGRIRADPGYRGPGAVRGIPRPDTRRVERPAYEQLMREIEASSYLAVGRRYGVSDTAIRKWVRQYERERENDERQDNRDDLED
jgi:hypothetical protein